MKYSIQIIILVLLTGILISFSSSMCNHSRTLVNSSKLKNDSAIFIKTDRTIYQTSDTIRVTVNGDLWCDGECIATPHFGLLKLQGLTWDTIVNLKESCQLQLDCGASFINFHEAPFEISRNKISFTPVSLSTGIYKLSVINSDRTKIIYSEKFELR